MAGQKFNVSVNPDREALFYVDYSHMDVYVNINDSNDVKTNNDPAIAQNPDVYRFDDTLTQARFDSFKKQFVKKMQDKFKSLKPHDITTKGKHQLLMNDMFIIAFEDNDWSVAVELLENPKSKNPNLRPNLFPNFQKGMRDILLDLVGEIHIRTGSWSTQKMTKADAAAKDAAIAAAKAAEKAEEDTIAANGIPDMDDIPAINATNDTTATNTAESAATNTEDTKTDTTASVPTADVPATDTNAESR